MSTPVAPVGEPAAGTAAPPVEVVTPEGRTTILKANALGLPALFFCIATAAAPLTALLFNDAGDRVGRRVGRARGVHRGDLMLLIFSVGYLEIGKRVTTAGGFYSFASHGFGRIGRPRHRRGRRGLLCRALGRAHRRVRLLRLDLGGRLVRVHDPHRVLLFGTLIVNVGFLWFEVQITARILGVFFVAEVAVSLIFAFAVLLQGGDSGLSASPLNPLELVDNSAAIAAFGAAAPGIALFGAFWSYVGFEMGPNYSEETRERTRVLSRATYATLLILGVFYVFVTYAFVTGYGLDGTAAGVAAQFDGQTALGLTTR